MGQSLDHSTTILTKKPERRERSQELALANAGVRPAQTHHLPKDQEASLVQGVSAAAKCERGANTSAHGFAEETGLQVAS